MPKNSEAVEQVPVGTNADQTGPQKVVLSNDTIARTRMFPLLSMEQIPEVPAGYVSPTMDERRRELRSLDDELTAETVLSLQELAAMDPKELADDLGDARDDVQDPGKLAAELVSIDRLIVKVGDLMEFLTTRRAIAASDAVVMLEAVVAEIDHRARRNPKIRNRYAATYKVMATRSAKISEGLAAARAAKAAKKPA
jgi:hypothetical protein